MFFEPRDFDLVLWVAGIGAAPYLEDGEVLGGSDWSELNRIFRGNFLGYAFWFNWRTLEAWGPGRVFNPCDEPIRTRLNERLARLSAAEIIKTETVVTAVAEKSNDGRIRACRDDLVQVAERVKSRH